MTFWHGPSTSPDAPNGTSRAEGVLNFSDITTNPVLGEVRLPKNAGAATTIEVAFFATDGTTRVAGWVHTVHCATRGDGDVDPGGDTGTVGGGFADSSLWGSGMAVESQTQLFNFIIEHLADRITFAFKYELSDVGTLAGHLRYVIRDLLGNEVTGRER